MPTTDDRTSRRNKYARQAQQQQLDIDTSLAASSAGGGGGSANSSAIRDIAPHTPPSRSLSFSSNTRRPSRRHNASFLDTTDQTIVSVDMADQYNPRARDSHDLSLSPRNVTRDSLVTNMLLSLDQFSTTQKPSRRPTYEDDDESPRFFDIPRSRSENHAIDLKGAAGHRYSQSSEVDVDGSAKISSQYSRERRSNSSTAYPQDIHGRFNGGRDNMQRSYPPPSRGAAHARGGRGSKSSSVTSLENNSSQRWDRGGVPRSASFDSGPHPNKHQHLQTLEHVPQSPFSASFTNSYLADDFDAAPMPTVPGGPRRAPSMPSIPRQSEPTELSSVTRFLNSSSSRSIKSASGKSTKAANVREAAPPLPTTLDADSAPAPNVGYGKSKDPASGAQPSEPVPAPLPQPKERTGFFRKFFGGGSSKNSSPAPATHPLPPARINSAAESIESPRKMPLHVHASKSAPVTPLLDSSAFPSPQPVLQKKPSSFFRRRKKSVIDDAPPVPSTADAPPMPPLAPEKVQTEKDKQAPQIEHSPVSSLRQVMNPYLRDGQTAPQTPKKGTAPLADFTNRSPVKSEERSKQEEYKKDFSPDYEPSPNARIRTVRSNLNRDPGAAETPTRKPQQQTQPQTSPTGNDSFLDLDGASDNDEEPVLTPEIKITSRNSMQDTSLEDTIRAKKSSRPPLLVEDSKSSRSSPKTTPGGSPTTRAESSEPTIKPSRRAMKTKGLDEPDFVVGDPTEDDRQKAQKIYDGNEDFIQKGKAAAWMGEEGPVRKRTLQAYMELYDFANESVVYALRQVCSRLVFRAETQQVDRILVAFSKTWCGCNPNHGFKATDVIHTICYSIMLLNTDLHVADIEQKMTRGQFVKNTMGTIIQAVEEAVPNAFDRRPSILPEKNSSLATGEDPATPTPTDERKAFRYSFRPPPRQEGQTGSFYDNADDCGPLVKSPFQGTIKQWEEQVEIVLKGIYSSIRDERLPLFGADPLKSVVNTPSQASLSVMGMLKRTPSILSKAPSESQLSLRGRADGSRPPNSRWNSKSRSRPGLGRNGLSSSRTSFEDGNSFWSPAMSSATWSRQSLGRTQTSVSQDSFGSAMPKGDYQQSIGFANALSQAIIRDEDMAGSIMSADVHPHQLLEDESLELAGPPWVKEGMVIHKHHLDGVEKRAKDRNWSEVFAVIQKGQLSLFSFTSNKSTRQKKSKNTGPVGGGNWQDNATNLGTFSLRQTLASALPPPGYSRARPHVWALSLPSGAVHLFQVGTADIIKEFVTTANYWSARLSTHPLVGGISNIEYGWSENIVNNSLVAAINDSEVRSESRPGSRVGHGRKSSVTGSLRSASIDQAASAFTSMSGRGKLPGDRAHIAEWTPPSQSLRPSNAAEMEHLTSLTAYVKGIEIDLQAHNQLRSPMLLAFTPRGHSAHKAMANWERKSAYLLREIVKFRTYVDCLQQAEARKQEIYAERDLAQRAARGELADGEMDLSSSEEDDEGDLTLRP